MPQAARNNIDAESRRPPQLPDGQGDARARDERERAALWEYRFLNQFLVPLTQAVFDWLAERPPTSVATYDAWVMSYVGNTAERTAMLQALETHHLIEIVGGMISVTPKGREYLRWRGPLDKFLIAKGVIRREDIPPPAAEAPPPALPAPGPPEG